MTTRKAAELMDLSPDAVKALRDSLFAWLYITCSQYDTVVSAASDDDATRKVTGDLTAYVDITKPGFTDKIALAVKNVRLYQENYGPVAAQLSAFGSDEWSGTTDHPLLTELKAIFVA